MYFIVEFASVYTVYPPAFGVEGGHTRWVERGWGVNISEDARHCSVLYTCKYFVVLDLILSAGIFYWSNFLDILSYPITWNKLIVSEIFLQEPLPVLDSLHKEQYKTVLLYLFM